MMHKVPKSVLLIASLPREREQIRLALATARATAGCTIVDVPEASTLNRILSQPGGSPPCDMVLADLAFDGMTGREVVGRVRLAMPDVPIVLLTGSEDPSVIAALAPDIAAPVVSKTPEALAHLPQVIQTALHYAEQATPDTSSLLDTTSQQIFHKSRVAMLLLTPDTLAIQDANLAACSLYGYSRAELASRALAELTVDPRYGLEEALSEAVRGDGTLVCRQRLVSGEQRDVELYVTPIESEGQTLLHAIVYDVTERLLFERALHQSEERFRRLAENAPDMIFRWSYAQGFEYVNPAATEVIGYTPEEHYDDPGLGYRSILIDDLPVYESVFSDLADPEGPRRYCVIRWHHKDGHLVYVEMRMTPLFDEHGNLLAIEGIARDISQHIRARERLRELTTRLTQAHEEERRRLARELHDEIGQALTIARIRTRMLEKGLPEDADETREKINTLDTLIREMLQNVRALSHELRPPLLDEMGWKPALEALCESFSRRTTLPVSFVTSGDDERVAATIELTAYRVVQEALTNIARHAQATEASVHARLDDDSLHLTITDNGVGFDTEAVMQAARSDVGLGLLGMHERAETVGGHIEISSTPGEGTRVDVRLPREEGKP